MALLEYLRQEMLEDADFVRLSASEQERCIRRFDALASGAIVEARSDAVASADPLSSDATSIGDPAVWVGDDPAVIGAEIVIGAGETRVEAYLVRPAEDGRRPSVVVVHDRNARTPYALDVGRRLAKAGFTALVPDLLTPVGGTRAFSERPDIWAALASFDRQLLVAELQACVTFLAESDPTGTGKIGALGFCFGGGMVWQLITDDRRLSAAVPFYGLGPALERVPEINAPTFAIYAEDDERINAEIPAIERAMREHEKTFEWKMYEGTKHAFHCDTNPEMYAAEAAKDAWTRAVAWLDRWLK